MKNLYEDKIFLKNYVKMLLFCFNISSEASINNYNYNCNYFIYSCVAPKSRSVFVPGVCKHIGRIWGENVSSRRNLSSSFISAK